MVLGVESAQLLNGQVMHHRLLPQSNKFNYSVFYIHLPIELLSKKLGNFLFGLNRSSLLSFHSSDYGDGKMKLFDWLSNILDQYKLDIVDRSKISLITLPRILGFAFNPVSFWICPDTDHHVRAVICEVNNTFGERHTYICMNSDLSVIQPNDVITAEKLFHVSPFLNREGYYQFRFSFDQRQFRALIDYYNDQDQKVLLTSVGGYFEKLSSGNIMKAFLRYPLLTFRVVYLIHWQALKVFIKGIKYVPKPKQKEILISQSLSSKDK